MDTIAKFCQICPTASSGDGQAPSIGNTTSSPEACLFINGSPYLGDQSQSNTVNVDRPERSKPSCFDLNACSPRARPFRIHWWTGPCATGIGTITAEHTRGEESPSSLRPVYKRSFASLAARPISVVGSLAGVGERAASPPDGANRLMVSIRAILAA
jgi:hypothetical protein